MKKKIGKSQKEHRSRSSDCINEWPNSSKYTRSKSDFQINLFKQLSLAFHPTVETRLRKDHSRKVKSASSNKMSTKGAPGSRAKADHSSRIISDKTFSEFPLADSAVLNEIRDAEQTAKQAAAQIAEMRDQIQALTQKDELTPAEMEELQKKQRDIVCKLTEFEDVTKKIQELVGLASVTCKDIPGGSNAKPPCSPRVGSKAAGDILPDLPRVIIPPFGGIPPAQVAQVMVCEQIAIEQVEGGCGGGWFQTAGGHGQPTSGWQAGGCNENAQQQFQPGCCQGQNDPRFKPAQDNPPSPTNCPEQPDPNTDIVGQLTDKLDASYRIQEKLAHENKEMECERYQLQEELLSRDKQTETICKQLESLQCELKLISAENCDLKKQVKNLNDQQQKPQPRASTGCNNNDTKPLCKQSLAKDPICRMDLYKQMGLPLPTDGSPGGQSVPTKNFQLGDMDAVVSSMEEEVRAMQKELGAVQAERRSLDLQKKLLKCATPRPNTTFPVCKKQVEMGASTASAPQLEMPKPPTPPPPPPPKPQPQCMRELENQLKELSQQYTQLNQDFNDKVAELSILRVEADKFREERKMLVLKKDEDQCKMDNLLTRIKVLEDEKEKWAGSKDVMLDIEQQMIMFKQKYLEKQELEDEMKLLINEQSLQLDDYRNKYIKAQEIVEGQRRDMDLMQKNHLRFSEQLTKELKSAKEEFQKRLEELSRLPDILKTTQQKLQESQQMRIIAEQNVEQLSSTVEELKEKLEIVQMELEKSLESADQNKENEDDGKLKLVVSELEERVLEVERQLEGKRQHVVMLEGQIDSMREEAARAVTRTKERCDVVRRGLQNQISDLEVQLAQARASARAAQKDRDMVREKMECQVQKLTKNFEEAQNWVRCLQSHVGFLKTSNRDLDFPSQPVDCLPKAFQPIAID